ncbi:MAG: hypothetical protein FE78DRAFT_76780 [Acidomyces sp. 'richmondensis']|nr:MAG: hypothetical protein FE78DRAFT_76780 [Acidomyces sp. 'richmondensis']
MTQEFLNLGADGVSADHANDRKYHLLLAATGSVATIKLPLIVSALSKHQNRLSIRLVLTDTAANFLADQSLEQPPLSSLLPLVDAIYLNSDEWALPWTRGAPILHIELRRWADLLVIAPLSANALSKICAGAADDLLTCVVRAWDTSGRVDGRKKGIVVAPAMNTAMWEHPVTMEQVRRLEGEWGDWFEVLKPVEKGLACGDVGGGAMRDWKEVVAVIERRLDHLN